MLDVYEKRVPMTKCLSHHKCKVFSLSKVEEEQF